VQAILAVIESASPNQINVDNSQIVLSPDDHIYRLILTTSTTYFNGRMEVNLYLVEALRRPDHGDATTTYLLKGLELASRFRFLFLERDSPFYARNLNMLHLEEVRDAVRDMVTELNLLHRDAREAGLHEPAVWGGLVDWTLLEKMSAEWRPRDERVRALCGKLLLAKTGEIGDIRSQLVDAIQELENGIRPLNRDLIIQLATRLREIVQANDAPNNIPTSQAA
jgi:hypothetical protein